MGLGCTFASLSFGASGRATVQRTGGLRRLACKRNLQGPPATNRPDGQITSVFQKSCQAHESKIFRFPRRPNHFYTSARLIRRERALRTSRNARWDAVDAGLRKTSAGFADGEV